MQLNESLWVLVIGMVLEIFILIFLFILVINIKIWTSKKYSDCLKKINEIERELEMISKVNNSVTEIQKNLIELKKVLK